VWANWVFFHQTGRLRVHLDLLCSLLDFWFPQSGLLVVPRSGFSFRVGLWVCGSVGFGFWVFGCAQIVEGEVIAAVEGSPKER
jgi:hypothetical protein